MGSTLITGLGVIAPIGTGKEPFAEGLCEGRSAVGEILSFDSSGYAIQAAAEVQEFELSDHIESSKNYVDRASAFALAACNMALVDAGWRDSGQEDGIGLSLGTAWGCWDTMELFGDKLIHGKPQAVPPFLFGHCYANTPGSLTSIEYGLRGFNACFTCGMASGLNAIGYARDAIELGRSKRILAGGLDVLSEALVKGLSDSGRCAAGPDAVAAPFDRSRGGMVLGEGAAVLALEEADAARARGAQIYGEVLGYGTTGDTDTRTGVQRAMEAALDEAGVSTGDLGLIVAHANSSVDDDRVEAEAIAALLGEHASSVPVTSIKGMVGEPMAAGGPMSVVATLLALKSGTMPRTIGLADPEVPGLSYVTDSREAAQGRVVLVNSLDPGGSCISLAMRG